MLVVYFNQQTGAGHAVSGSKSFVFVLKQVFSLFPHKQKKERK